MCIYVGLGKTKEYWTSGGCENVEKKVLTEC